MANYSKHIGMVERNRQGGYTVYGDIGHRQYIGYTKTEAIKKYNNEVRRSQQPRFNYKNNYTRYKKS